MWPLVSAHGLEDKVEAFLTEMLLEGQMWGGVVEGDGYKGPVSFGACVFVHRNLRDALIAGRHHHLILDFVRDFDTKCHILSYKQVQQGSAAANLNFYGTLFTFPRVHWWDFFNCLGALQQSLMENLSGFQIDRHFKHIYPTGPVYKLFGSIAMRVGFGADTLATYDQVDLPERYKPVLFGQSRAQIAATKNETEIEKLKLDKPVAQLLCQSKPILGLTDNMRAVLRLELEGYSPTQIKESLGKYSDRYDIATRSWEYAAEKLQKSGKLPELIRKLCQDRRFQEGVKLYVKDNRREIGILPPLTEKEKDDWYEKVRSGLNLLDDDCLAPPMDWVVPHDESVFTREL